MLGDLPKSLTVRGVVYPIRSDYRDVLRVISAYNAPELSTQEKVYVCLRQIFVDSEKIPENALPDAYKAAINFIECSTKNGAENSPVLVDWEKDEQLIFAAINKTAGFEVRGVDYLHWWTFLGYFQNVDSNDVWGQILTIRQKKAKHKKLEKWEQEFYNANTDMCTVGKVLTTKDLRERSYKALEDFYNDLQADEEE